MLSFSVPMLMVGRQELHPACNKPAAADTEVLRGDPHNPEK